MCSLLVDNFLNSHNLSPRQFINFVRRFYILITLGIESKGFYGSLPSEA